MASIIPPPLSSFLDCILAWPPWGRKIPSSHFFSPLPLHPPSLSVDCWPFRVVLSHDGWRFASIHPTSFHSPSYSSSSSIVMSAPSFLPPFLSSLLLIGHSAHEGEASSHRSLRTRIFCAPKSDFQTEFREKWWLFLFRLKLDVTITPCLYPLPGPFCSPLPSPLGAGFRSDIYSVLWPPICHLGRTRRGSWHDAFSSSGCHQDIIICLRLRKPKQDFFGYGCPNLLEIGGKVVSFPPFHLLLWFLPTCPSIFPPERQALSS